MKLFNDLKFEPHSLSNEIEQLSRAKRASEKFENGYGVSVLFGSAFYSNGINTYEVAVLYEGEVCYSTDITDDVMSNLSEQEVSEVMTRIQNLKTPQ